MAGRFLACLVGVISLVNGAAVAPAAPEHTAAFDDIATKSGTGGVGIMVKDAPIPNPYHNNEIIFSADFLAVDLSDQPLTKLTPPSTPNAAISRDKTVGDVVGTLTAPNKAYFNLHQFSYACAQNFVMAPEALSCDVKLDCVVSGKVQSTTFSFGGSRFFNAIQLGYQKVTSCTITVTRASFSGGVSDKRVTFLLDNVLYDVGK